MPDQTPSIWPLQLEHVTLRLDKKQLISNITCSLEEAGKTVVLGPNGAGKSLFLRLICGLLKPTSGTISGGLAEQCNKNGARVSLVFQKPVLLRRSTFENIAFVLRQQTGNQSDRSEIIFQALQQARLETQAKTPARQLSGGEQQRLALARALVVNPDVLLLDEPTASLDPASTFIVEEMIAKAHKKGVKIILVTHDIKQAKRLADDIMFIHDGHMLVHKPANAFFREPESKQAQAYLDGRVPD